VLPTDADLVDDWAQPLAHSEPDHPGSGFDIFD
jgi:hypothetical protein